ncbi:MAG: hypothetical protein LUC85_06745 [Bacteroidales bacterium]|nr:hypothetical protein [Bacteroidales bacterium]
MKLSRPSVYGSVGHKLADKNPFLPRKRPSESYEETLKAINEMVPDDDDALLVITYSPYARPTFVGAVKGNYEQRQYIERIADVIRENNCESLIEQLYKSLFAQQLWWEERCWEERVSEAENASLQKIKDAYNQGKTEEFSRIVDLLKGVPTTSKN